MKRIFVLVLIILLIGAAVTAWLFLGPATAFDEEKKFLYIRTNSTKEAVLDSLKKNNLVKNEAAFNWLANRLTYWQNIKPGKYEIKKSAGLLSIIRKLRNGDQTPVKLVINKIRTKEDLARLIGSRFDCDSVQIITFLNNTDSLIEFGVDTQTILSIVLPDTYTYNWSTTSKKIFQKLYNESKKFWTNERLKKAEANGLTQLTTSVVASIVEEETNNYAEKGNIASVYLNRMKNGMPLQADPTIKFAWKNFALKRIYEKYLFIESPYNTYKNKGLPPGPICTPSKQTIDAVLNAPKTDYLYFVASSKFNGTHDFSNTYEEHLIKAKEYQKALNKLDSAKSANMQNAL